MNNISIKRILTFSKRNIKEIIREPISFIFLFILPISMLILFYFAFSSMTSQFEMKYLGPGMISFANVFLSLFSAQIIAEDKETSFASRLYTTPLKSSEFVLGYVASIIPIGLIQTFTVLVVACILDFSFFNFSILLCIPFSIVSILLFVGFGLLIGSLLNSKAVGGVASILICGQSMLSGMWFPLEQMSESFNNFIKVLPFRSGSLMFQNLCLGFGDNYFNGVIEPFLILLVYSVVILIVSIFVYSKKMKEK